MAKLHSQLVILLSVMLGACTNGSSELIITSLARLTNGGAPCAEGDESQLSFGVLDVGFADRYQVALNLYNRTDSNGEDILIEGMNIRIWQGGRPAGDSAYSFYQPVAGYVRAGDSSAVQLVAIPSVAVETLLRMQFPDYGTTAIPFDDFLAYEDLITIGIRALGETTGDEELESAEFYVPVYFCFGCLVHCTAESLDLETGMYCMSPEIPTVSPCILGQDESFDCRHCTPYFDAATCLDFCQYAP